MPVERQPSLIERCPHFRGCYVQFLRANSEIEFFKAGRKGSLGLISMVISELEQGLPVWIVTMHLLMDEH